GAGTRGPRYTLGLRIAIERGFQTYFEHAARQGARPRHEFARPGTLTAWPTRAPGKAHRVAGLPSGGRRSSSSTPPRWRPPLPPPSGPTLQRTAHAGAFLAPSTALQFTSCPSETR